MIAIEIILQGYETSVHSLGFEVLALLSIVDSAACLDVVTEEIPKEAQWNFGWIERVRKLDKPKRELWMGLCVHY